MRFHPLAKDVLASASFDMTCKIWDLETGEAKITLEGHTDSVSEALLLCFHLLRFLEKKLSLYVVMYVVIFLTVPICDAFSDTVPELER